MNALTGPIAPLYAYERTEDRRATRLTTAWLVHDRSVAPKTGGRALIRDGDAAVPVVPDSPTLVVVSDAVRATAASAGSAISAGMRTYVLAPADGTGDASLERLAAAGPTQLLVRRVEEAPAAAVLVGHTGWLWIGRNGPGIWRLALDERQVEAARRAFLELWWEHADDEAWPSSSGLTWRPRGDAPFDLPGVLADAPVQLQPTSGQPLMPSGARVYAPEGKLPDGRPEQIFVPASGDGHERLAAEVRRGSRVAWSDLGLPTCAAGAGAAIVPSTSRWSLRVSLNASQAADLTRVLDAQPEATFAADVALADIESRLSGTGRVWRAGAAEPERLVGTEELDAGTIEATSLRELASAEPATWPAPSPLALSARWRWRVRPPLSPSGASEDPLVKAWRSVDQRYAARVKHDMEVLEAIERREGRLLESGEERGAALGFRRTRKELEKALSTPGATSPSVRGPEAARNMLRRLHHIEDQVTALDENVSRREHALLERTERARQEREHAARHEDARKQLPELEAGLQAAQQQLDDTEAALGPLASRRAEMSKKNYRAARRKAHDDLDKARREVKRLEQEVEGTQTVIDTPFAYRPPAARRPERTGSGSFIPPKSAPREEDVPSEALPATGLLLRSGGERLLAIASWDDLEQGEQHAARLGARLVATAEEA